MNRPGLWSIFFGLLCVSFIAAGLFVLNEPTDRMLAVLLGLHFGNRSEIAEIRADLKRAEHSAYGMGVGR